MSTHLPRTVPFGTCPLNVNTSHTKTERKLSAATQSVGSAQADWMTHCRFLKLCKPNFSMTSAAVTALSTSWLSVDNHHQRIAHLVFVKHFKEFFVCLLNSVSVIAVNGVDRTVYSPVVLTPWSLNLVLASRAPRGEIRILALHCLNSEPDGQDCGRRFIEFPLRQHCSLFSPIEPPISSSRSYQPSSPIFGQSSASAARDLDPELATPLPPLLPLPLCRYCSVTAVCRLPRCTPLTKPSLH